MKEISEEEQLYFEKMKSAINQAIKGNVIRVVGDFKNEDEFFDWLVSQQPAGQE